MVGKPFQKGYDPRRHFLTRLDCQKGYRAAPSRIRSRIRSLYRGGKVGKKGGEGWAGAPTLDDMPS